MLRDCLCFISVRFAIIKYTSKSDKKISVPDGQTDRQNDRLTDICISRAAFAAENMTIMTITKPDLYQPNICIGIVVVIRIFGT